MYRYLKPARKSFIAENYLKKGKEEEKKKATY